MSAFLYSLLLRVLPSRLRRRHGDAMVACFVELLAEARRRTGWRGWAAAWIRGAWDVLRRAPLERRRARRRAGRRDKEATEAHDPPKGFDATDSPDATEPPDSTDPHDSIEPHDSTDPRRSPRNEGRMSEGLLSGFATDVRYAFRTFRHDPGYVAVAALTLAVGLAANSVLFGMVNGLVFAELPYEDAERLRIVWKHDPDHGIETGSMSPADFADIRERNRVFEEMAAQDRWEVNLSGGGAPPKRAIGYKVTGNLFDLLGVEARIGRTFLPEEDETGGPPVVVLSHRLWTQRFGADESIVGDTIRLDERPYEVVGIMPPDFHYPQFQFSGELWVPLQLTARQEREVRGNQFLVLIGRLRDRVTPERAQRDMDRVMAQLAEEYPEANAGEGARVAGFREQMTGPILPAVTVMLVAAAFVLLICCANVANLALARGSSRQGELAVRNALGAGRFRLVRQLVTESTLIGLAGGVIGWVVAEAGSRLLMASLPDFVRRVATTAVEAEADMRILAATLVASLVAGAGFGLLPALRVTRTDLQENLKGGARKLAAGLGTSRLRNTLVVSQVALSVVLLVGAGLVIRGFLSLVDVDPGFEPEGAVAVRLTLSDEEYGDADAVRDFYRRVADEVDSLPRVREVGLVNALPLSFYDSSSSFEVDGRPEPGPGRKPMAGKRFVDPGYFAAMEIPVVRGRGFTREDDRDGAAPVAIVNRALVRRYFEDEEPLGQRVRFGRDTPWMEIVGVIGDVRHSSIAQGPQPELYVPLEQRIDDTMTLVARTGDDRPAALAGSIRQRIWSVDPDVPVEEVRPVSAIVSDSLFIFRMPAVLMGIFAAGTVLLAAVGLYGVIAYVVARRTNEIGVRLAQGASRRTVLGLVMRQGILLTGIGVALGLVGALLVGQVLATVLTGVQGTEPLVLVGVPAVLVIVALLACFLPARRATRVDPVLALRRE